MIFLAFLLPLAIYLLILGNLNSREHPVMVPGPWDFAGILFAASGFLLFGGPAILSSFNERGRLFWMLGEGKGPAAGGDGDWSIWILLSLLYFLLVVAGSAFLLWRQRSYTAIYNAERGVVERALQQACVQVGVESLRSGDLFFFGLAGPWAAGRRAGMEEIQSPHDRPSGTVGNAEAWREASTKLPGGTAERVTLEIDSFPWLRHLSLRWDPADAAVRTEIEGELRRLLQQTPPPDFAVGYWMTVLSQALFILIFLGGLVVLILRML